MKTGRVYKIITNQGTEIYVGSTFDDLAQRFKGHKNAFKRWKEGKMASCSVYDLFDKYGVAGCKMVLIKEYECIDRAHLEAYETLWINKLKGVNKNNPFGSGIKILDKQRIKEYREKNKDKIKEWRENNKDKIKEYYEVNKAAILEKMKEKIECPICGKSITKKHLKTHKKTIHPPPAPTV